MNGDNIKIKSSDLVFEPSGRDIMEFEVLYSDFTLWQAMCRLAKDINTTVGELWFAMQAVMLSDLGYYDPNNPKDVPGRVNVTLRDLIKRPYDLPGVRDFTRKQDEDEEDDDDV